MGTWTHFVRATSAAHSGESMAAAAMRVLMMTHKYRGSIVVLSISKSVEPNEE